MVTLAGTTDSFKKLNGVRHQFRRKWLGLLCAVIIVGSSFNISGYANTSDGTGVTIAVIDFAGTDSASPELTGIITHEVCMDALVAVGHPGDLSFCPGRGALVEGVGAAATQLKSDGSVLWNDGAHGTKVASVIAGRTVGIAKGVRIIAIRSLYATKPALQWINDNAAKYNISAVVGSFGSPPNAARRDYKPCLEVTETVAGKDSTIVPIVEALRAKGIAMFFAAGNDALATTIHHPACLPSTISVGATDGIKIASYSNASADLTILAPGTLSVSTMTRADTFIIKTDQGTSFAAPYAAAVYAKVRAAYPALTVDQIIAAMRHTGTLINDVKVKKIPAINQDALFTFLGSGQSIPTLSSTLTAQQASLPSSAVSSSSAQTDALQKQVDSLTLKIDDLTKQLSNADTLRAQVSDLLAKINDLSAKNTDLATQLVEANKRINSQRPKISTIVCLKGTTRLKVSGINPLCPSKYRKQ